MAGNSVISFHSGEGPECLLAGITVKGGKAERGGGISISNASPTIQDCVIKENESTGLWPSGGGGVFIRDSNPRFRRCVISKNKAQQSGGCYIHGSSVRIDRCVFSANQARKINYQQYDQGFCGGLYLYESTASIVDTTIAGNTASRHSGGLNIFDSSVTLLRCNISGNEAEIGNYAWYEDNTEDMIVPTKGKKPNALGLYDMSGNVWEWVEDYFDFDYYKISPKSNPFGADYSLFRVVRGGSVFDPPNKLRTTYRYGLEHNRRSLNVGFRLAE